MTDSSHRTLVAKAHTNDEQDVADLAWQLGRIHATMTVGQIIWHFDNTPRHDDRWRYGSVERTHAALQTLIDRKCAHRVGWNGLGSAVFAYGAGKPHQRTIDGVLPR
jgi:hypothetical protein